MAKKTTKKSTTSPAKLPDIDPWERQPSETSEAFAAWIVFRDMEGKRSRERVAVESQVSTALINRWSQDWHWTDRLRRWENHLDAVARQATIQAIVDYRKRAARQVLAKSQTMMLVDMALNRRMADMGNDPAKLLEKMSVAELLALSIKSAQALPNLLRAEALALGDSTERTEVTTHRDSLSQQIAGSDRLRSLAAALIEEASLGAEV